MKEDDSHWTRLSRDTVYDNPWIQVHHDEVENPNGGKGIYGVIHFKNYAIGILPVDENGWTWLVGQRRYPLDYYSWEIPEGGGKIGASILDSAKRELAEEVGLEAASWREMLRSETSNSATDERAILYLATDLSPAKEIEMDKTEKLQIRHLPLSEAIQLMDEGKITDSLSVIALMWAARHILPK